MERIRLTNVKDHQLALAGELDPRLVHTVEIDALVDTGATCLAIPADAAAALGVPIEGTRQVKFADGRRGAVPMASGIRIEILGRWMTLDALVLPEGATALIGQIPLEGLDLVVDPKHRTLRANPESPDAPLMDLLRAG